MNLWRQTHLYGCKTCGARLLHDRMYLHACFTCPNRKRSAETQAGDRSRAGLTLSERQAQEALDDPSQNPGSPFSVLGGPDGP